jgi:Holliday junction resolvasome RuvABC endonuclease subunit
MREQESILGLSPGTLSLGYVVLQEGVPVDWGIKTFTGKWSREKLKKIILTMKSIASMYQVSHIAVKSIHQSRSSTALGTLISELKWISATCLITYAESDIEKIKKKLLGTECTGKTELIRVLKEKYPQLASLEVDEGSKYYTRLYEALAVALSLS